MNTRHVLLGLLVAIAALYALWFHDDRHALPALLVFVLPPLLLAWQVWRGGRHAAFWAGVLALGWFSHAVMVAWAHPAQRWLACAAIGLSVGVVFAASLPGLRARRAARKPPQAG